MESEWYTNCYSVTATTTRVSGTVNTHTHTHTHTQCMRVCACACAWIAIQVNIIHEFKNDSSESIEPLRQPRTLLNYPCSVSPSSYHLHHHFNCIYNTLHLELIRPTLPSPPHPSPPSLPEASHVYKVKNDQLTSCFGLFLRVKVHKFVQHVLNCMCSVTVML